MRRHEFLLLCFLVTTMVAFRFVKTGGLLSSSAHNADEEAPKSPPPLESPQISSATRPITTAAEDSHNLPHSTGSIRGNQKTAVSLAASLLQDNQKLSKDVASAKTEATACVAATRRLETEVRALHAEKRKLKAELHKAKEAHLQQVPPTTQLSNASNKHASSDKQLAELRDTAAALLKDNQKLKQATNCICPKTSKKPCSTPQASASAFPRIVHQTGKSSRVNKVYIPYVASWVRMNPGPGWSYKFWTDSENRRFVQAEFPQYLALYDGFPQGVQRADTVRYMLMYVYGGVYADLDFECVRSFDSLLDELQDSAGVIIGEEPLAHSYLLSQKRHIACNALLVSKPQHKFWLMVLGMIHEASMQSADPVDSTGPRLLQRAYEQWRSRTASFASLRRDAQVRVVGAEYFYPRLALWNKRNIFDLPCAPFVGAHATGRVDSFGGFGGHASLVEKRELCLTIARVGWERYANGYLFTNRTFASHHWFFNWNMDRKTYHPDENMHIRDILALARNTSITLNRTDYMQAYGRKTKTKRVAADASVGHLECRGWRQTGDCDPVAGPREQEHDLPCDAQVPSGASGYCKCTKGHMVSLVKCDHAPFTCAAKCANPVDSSYNPPHAAVASDWERQEPEPLAWGGRAGLASECEDDKKRLCGKVKPGGGRTHKCMEAHIQNLSKACRDVEFPQKHQPRKRGGVPSEGGCVGWRQTGGCDPAGEREQEFDKTCEETVPDGASGFCQCEAGRTAKRVPCEHAEFTCKDACTSTSIDWWRRMMRPLQSFQQNTTNRTIPRIIHQAWPSNKVLATLAPNILSYLILNKGWAYQKWTPARLKTFVREQYPALELFVRDRPLAMKYLLLFHYGGAFVDLSSEALQPMDRLISNHSCIIGQEPAAHAHVLNHLDRMICNAVMFSCPGHPFWLEVFKLMARRSHLNVMDATGPRMLTDALALYEQRQRNASTLDPVWVAPAATFNPNFDEENEQLRVSCESGRLAARCKVFEPRVCRNRKASCEKLHRLDFRNPPPNGGTSPWRDTLKTAISRAKLIAGNATAVKAVTLQWTPVLDTHLPMNSVVRLKNADDASLNGQIGVTASNKTAFSNGAGYLVRLDESGEVLKWLLAGLEQAAFVDSSVTSSSVTSSALHARGRSLAPAYDGAMPLYGNWSLNGRSVNRSDTRTKSKSNSKSPALSLPSFAYHHWRVQLRPRLQTVPKECTVSLASIRSALWVREGDECERRRVEAQVNAPPVFTFGHPLSSEATTEALDEEGLIKHPPLLRRTTPFNKSEAGECAVPRIIHQTWKTDKVQSVFAARIHSWVKQNPTWEYRFWTDAQNRDFMKRRFPEFLGMYDKFSSNIKRADAIRYFLLYEFGGMYTDLDFEALQPMDRLIANHSCIIGQEPAAHAHVLNHLDRMICNAVMFSCPGHPFWLEVFKLMARRSHLNVMDATGPRMLTDALALYEQRQRNASTLDPVWVPPAEILYPHFDEKNAALRTNCQADRLTARCKTDTKRLTGIACKRRRETCAELRKHNYKNLPLSNRSFANHHWSHTWLGGVYDFCHLKVSTIVSNTTSSADWEKELQKCKIRQDGYNHFDLNNDKSFQMEKQNSKLQKQLSEMRSLLQKIHSYTQSKNKSNSALLTETVADWAAKEASRKDEESTSGRPSTDTDIGIFSPLGFEPEPLAWGGRAGLASECEDDKKRLCGKVKPGGGRTHKCMEAHIQNLSKACRDVEFPQKQKQGK